MASGRGSRKHEAKAGRDQLELDLIQDGPEATLERRRDRSRRAGSQSRGPRLTLTRAEASRALGISVDSFERYVQPEVRMVRRNSIRLVPVRELERWIEENAVPVIEDR